ncbi:hypothetical protein [Clostridium sp. DJ247]|uniref:hypothetical protein n=1 Tax=Clostridium sp. DJ247 TaxID=2726188 RepID=UPI001629CEC9|nr:hypothetical protein [Clostridium sp. DJ247]MBC2582890.1 hypothetical protein [Clostridium sp. DJ247]
MRHIEEVLKDIKQIDCQADQLEDQFRTACDGYEYKGNSRLVVNRNKELDQIGLNAYSIYVDEPQAPKIVAMVKEGRDHYVSTVVNAYVK